MFKCFQPVCILFLSLFERYILFAVHYIRHIPQDRLPCLWHRRSSESFHSTQNQPTASLFNQLTTGLSNQPTAGLSNQPTAGPSQSTNHWSLPILIQATVIGWTGLTNFRLQPQWTGTNQRSCYGCQFNIWKIKVQTTWWRLTPEVKQDYQAEKVLWTFNCTLLNFRPESGNQMNSWEILKTSGVFL